MREPRAVLADMLSARRALADAFGRQIDPAIARYDAVFDEAMDLADAGSADPVCGLFAEMAAALARFDKEAEDRQAAGMSIALSDPDHEWEALWTRAAEMNRTETADA